MANKKFKLTLETKIIFGRKLYRIEALVSIERWGIKKGDLGGWVESEKNLDVSGDAWVSGDAQVSGDARVSGNAQVSSQTLYTFGPIGSREGYTSYAAESDTIMCGCFFGTMAEFENAVEKTHGQTAHGDNYRALIAMLKSLK